MIICNAAVKSSSAGGSSGDSMVDFVELVQAVVQAGCLWV